MALTKLGNYIEQIYTTNENDLYDEDAVVGISTQKTIIPTKANLDGVKLTSYKLLPPDHFAYVPDTSRRGDKMSLCFNNTKDTFLVSSISIVFRVKNTDELNSDYLYMFFNRPEFDRYSRFNSWGSARETFNWDDMCDIDIELPSLPIQQKYVDVYKSLLNNQQNYERGLDDLKLVCDAYIENIRKRIPCKKIGKYIKEIDVRNKNMQVTLLQGFCMSGDFIEPRRISVDIPSLKILEKGHLVYNRAVECVSDRFIISQRTGETCAVSNSYIIFTSIDENVLMNKYLLLWLRRPEFARYSKFMSHGTTHENFEYYDMEDVEIPIPDLDIQRSIVDIYDCYAERKSINDKLKVQLKDICPILIKGSVEEAKTEE